jgi:hypothetical protein
MLVARIQVSAETAGAVLLLPEVRNVSPWGELQNSSPSALPLLRATQAHSVSFATTEQPFVITARRNYRIDC